MPTKIALALTAEGRMEKTLPFRFSLDESFDIGEDIGTPVIHEYDAKMSFPLTGALRRVEFKLGPDTITNAQRAALQRFGSRLKWQSRKRNDRPDTALGSAVSSGNDA